MMYKGGRIALIALLALLTPDTAHADKGHHKKRAAHDEPIIGDITREFAGTPTDPKRDWTLSPVLVGYTAYPSVPLVSQVQCMMAPHQCAISWDYMEWHQRDADTAAGVYAMCAELMGAENCEVGYIITRSAVTHVDCKYPSEASGNRAVQVADDIEFVMEGRFVDALQRKYNHSLPPPKFTHDRGGLFMPGWSCDHRFLYSVRVAEHAKPPTPATR